MNSRHDVAIIGAGILGVTIGYWLSRITKHSVVIIDKEGEVGFHTSSRNTGVVHRPFYLNPQKKRLFASADSKILLSLGEPCGSISPPVGSCRNSRSCHERLTTDTPGGVQEPGHFAME